MTSCIRYLTLLIQTYIFDQLPLSNMPTPELSNFDRILAIFVFRIQGGGMF
jgi:hypothetical protein